MANRYTPVIFDGEMDGICIAFYPSRPNTREDADLLWWVPPPTVESIFEVARFVNHHRLPVRAIVIGGLDAYPIGESRWPRWLAKLSQVSGAQIIVDTDGLSARQRQRLISGTRRHCEMSEKQDPIAATLVAIKNWAQRRVTWN